MHYLHLLPMQRDDVVDPIAAGIPDYDTIIPEIEQFLAKAYASPEPIVQRAGALVEPSGRPQ